MKISIIGATGNLGSSIAEEALARGHEVICISRNPHDIVHTEFPHIPSLYGDCADQDSLRQAIGADVDVLVNAVMPDPNAPMSFVGWVRNVIDIAKERRVGRLVAIGDSCVFEVKPGVLLKQTPFLTPFYRDWYGVHQYSHLEYVQEAELDWIEIAPAAKVFPDRKLREYQVAVDRLCTRNIDDPDYASQSYIGMEDFGFACVDEIEQPKYRRTRICIAY